MRESLFVRALSQCLEHVLVRAKAVGEGVAVHSVHRAGGDVGLRASWELSLAEPLGLQEGVVEVLWQPGYFSTRLRRTVSVWLIGKIARLL